MKFSSKCLIAAFAVVGFNSQASAFTSPTAFAGRAITSLDVSTLDEWQLLDSGAVVGSVKGHPTLTDGDIITTSPLANAADAQSDAFVSTLTGSQYRLGKPLQATSAAQKASEPGMERGTFMTSAGGIALVAGGFALGIGVGGGLGGTSTSSGKQMTVPEVSFP